MRISKFSALWAALAGLCDQLTAGVHWAANLLGAPPQRLQQGADDSACPAQIFTFVIGQCFLTMLCSMHYGVFLFFAGVVLIMTLWAAFFLPETKGRDLESTFRAFQEHWFWKTHSRVRTLLLLQLNSVSRIHLQCITAVHPPCSARLHSMTSW